MRPSLSLIWTSLHEPRVVTLVTMICYATLFLYGTYGVFHPLIYPSPYWEVSCVIMTLSTPFAFFASWHGMWQIERPVLFPVAGSLLANTIMSAYATATMGLVFAHVVVVALMAQAFVARWVRIKSSYESPARIEARFREQLGE